MSNLTEKERVFVQLMNNQTAGTSEYDLLERYEQLSIDEKDALNILAGGTKLQYVVDCTQQAIGMLRYKGYIDRDLVPTKLGKMVASVRGSLCLLACVRQTEYGAALQ